MDHLVRRLRVLLRRNLDGPMVRPFALLSPILILVIALPLLRPLRHPDPGDVSNEETLRLATIRALVEHGSLQLDRGYAKVPGTIQVDNAVYSNQPPMLAVVLAAPAWVINELGYTFEQNHLLIAYLLTLIGVTLPVAATAGLVYRMARLFELRRPWRALMAFGVVAGSGLLSYAVVLNPHAPAATLVIASAACLIHVAVMKREERRAGWFALAGGCAALAATFDPAAVVVLILFLCVIPAMRFSMPRRLAGMALFVIGAIPVISVHAAWNDPITGDIIPASVHQAFEPRAIVSEIGTANDEFFDEDETANQQSMWRAMGSQLAWMTNAVVGHHGVFSHFPITILGILGIAAVMHRHWPGSTKTLAAATGASAVVILLIYQRVRMDWSSAAFAAQWFIVFTPMLLFWSGAWLRRSHSPLAWTVAGLIFLFSVGVGLIGATDPLPRHGYNHYTAASALRRLTNSEAVAGSDVLAGRTE